jgi:hypothetical protein
MLALFAILLVAAYVVSLWSDGGYRIGPSVWAARLLMAAIAVLILGGLLRLATH